MRSCRDSCGTVVIYVIRTEVFLSMRCVPWKGSSSLPGLCVPVEKEPPKDAAFRLTDSVLKSLNQKLHVG